MRIPRTFSVGQGRGGDREVSPRAVLLDPLLDPLTQAATAALKRESYVLLPGRLAVAYDSQGASCPIGPAASETCLKAVAGRYGVESILKVAISREDQTLRIEVMLLDQVDDVAASASATCVGCVGERVATSWPTPSQVLTTGGGRVRGTLSAVSEPAGGELRIGSRVLGLTPLSQEAVGGKLRDHHPPRRAPTYTGQVEVKGDETAHVEAALVPLPSRERRACDRRRDGGERTEQAEPTQRRPSGIGAAGFRWGRSSWALVPRRWLPTGAAPRRACLIPSLCRRVYDTAVPGGGDGWRGQRAGHRRWRALILPLVTRRK